MSFVGVKDFIEKGYNGGQYCLTGFRKISGIASTQGHVVDFSMAAGNPRPNYYTGDALKAKAFTSEYGIWHGGNVSPSVKIIRKFAVLANNAGISPAWFTICDYLLFYPLIDMDTTDEQTFTNLVTLPRYTTGEGVQAMLVATNPYIGGASFYIEYTNSDGVAGRMSRIMTTNVSTYIGTVVHSGVTASLGGTFINLAPGDKGIRSVQAISFLGFNGGLAALALVRPLANVLVREITQYNEWDFLTMKGTTPVVQDGAFLGMIGAVNGNAAAQLVQGFIEVIWN